MSGPLRRSGRWLARQGRDAVVVWLLPFVAFCLPARLGHGLLAWFSRREWLYRERTERALRQARRFQPPADEASWKATFRMTVLIDAVDLWHGFFSTDRRLRRRLVDGPERWPGAEEGVVFIGVHLGTGTLMMRALRMAGFQPRIIYRGTLDRAILRHSPLLYAYMKLRIHYMRRVCGGKAIRVGGAGKRLKRSVTTPGVGVLLVVDAPVSETSPTRLRLLGRELPVSRKGLDIVAEERARYAFFSMVWDGARRRRVLTVGPARTAAPGDALLHESEAWVADQVARFGAQWQLWPAAGTVLLEGAESSARVTDGN